MCVYMHNIKYTIWATISSLVMQQAHSQFSWLPPISQWTLLFSPIFFLSFCIKFLYFLACLFIYLCYISWLPLLSLSDLQIQLQIWIYIPSGCHNVIDELGNPYLPHLEDRPFHNILCVVAIVQKSSHATYDLNNLIQINIWIIKTKKWSGMHIKEQW